MLTACGTVTIRPKEVVPIYREEWDATVTDYKYDFVNRDFVSRNGNIYQVKTQRPGQFVPAGIDPASVEGQEYWQVFNNLAPSVTNFLVIVDEDGKPRTLMSGGRIQTNFLNIGSLNMSETRLWGGAEPMTGKGLALVNDPGDRKFVVYENANNYVEMFQREDEWGLKGVNGDANNPIFSLGREYVYNSSTKQWEWVNNNKIAGMEITSNGIRSIGFSPSLQNGSCYAKNGFSVYASGSGVLAPSTGALQAGIITAKGDNALILGLEVIAHGNGYLKEITALKLSAKNDYSTPEKSPVALDVVAGDVNIRNGSLQVSQGSSISLDGLLYFGNPTISASSTIYLGFSSGHFVMLSPISGNPVVSVNAGLPVGSWFLIGQATTAGGYYYIKLSGNERFNRRGNAYQQVHSHNQDPTLIFKLSSTVWIVGNLPVNWIEWS